MTTTATAASETSTLVSTRTAPWMKIGILVEQPMTAAEAVKLGGLGFDVEKRELAFAHTTMVTATPVWKTVKERVAIVRSDTSEWLGIMSKDYPLLQYGEAFDFMDTVSPTYVAAGALKGGRQGFMVVKAPDHFSLLAGTDPHDLYAVLRTSHDGSRAVEVSVMPLRSRCMNQLTLRSFVAGVQHRWAIKHTTTMAAKLKDAQASLQNIGKYAAAFETTAKKLIKMKITNTTATAVLESVLPNRPRREDQIERILTAWHEAETVGFDGYGWGLVNAVSEYFDWTRTGGSAESRFVGALQGNTTNTINKVAGRLLSRV